MQVDKSISKRVEERSLIRANIMNMKREDIFSQFQMNANDRGSQSLQCALLTRRIELLTVHCNANRKDKHCRLALTNLVEKRRKMLKYTKRIAPDLYGDLIVNLGLRK